MTREDFIKAYCDHRKIPEGERREWGTEDADGWCLFAVPCTCSAGDCLGWKMSDISEDLQKLMDDTVARGGVVVRWVL